MSIKLSVIMITYNHGQYIKEAIEGVLNQKTNFKIQLIIAEDKSTDNTYSICKEYAEKHPDIIQLLPSDKNWGMIPNFLRAYEAAKESQYIAMCEGDDYWTNPSKLQKQVTFLDNNSNYSTCFHKVNIWKNNTLVEDYITTTPKNTSTLLDLSKGNYIHTASVVFRNGISFPDWFINTSAADYVIHCLNAQRGDIYYTEEPMAVYRVHVGGVWSLKSNVKKQLLWYKQYHLMSTHFTEPEIQKNLLEKAHTHYLRLLNFLEHNPEIAYQTLTELESDNRFEHDMVNRHQKLLYFLEHRFRDQNTFIQHLSKMLTPKLLFQIIKTKILNKLTSK